MQEGDDNNGEKARFLRKAQKQAGQDYEEQAQDKNFEQNFEKAIKAHSKKLMTKDLQKQIQYFDNKMQPFNMRQQQQMGQLDQDGFFVFSRKRGYKDAWLQSLKQQEQDNGIDRIRKRVKQQNRYQTVFDGDRKRNQQYNSQEQQQDKSDNHQSQEQQEGDNKQATFSGNQIKMLLSELLPFGTHANKYMKDLKKQKNQELYDKVLFLCNEYVEVTGEHDIFTIKRQELEQAFDEDEIKEDEPLNNWDEDRQSSQEHPDDKIEKKQEDDDIF